MDIGIVIIGATMLAVFVLPIILIHRGRKKTEKQLLQPLNDLAKKQHCNISNYEIWNNTSIGIDESQNMLFFFRRMKNDEISRYINLSEITKCRVLNTNSNVRVAEENFSIIEKIELVLSPKTKSSPDFILETYNAETNTQLSGEVQVSERWAKIIRERI